MKTIWQGAPTAMRGGWFMGGGWAARAVAQEEVVPGPNPNLLLWTEAFDNAVWVLSLGMSVSADAAASPEGPATAEELVSPVINAAVSQTSATAATAGAAVTTSGNLTGSWARLSVTGTFDGLPYTFSVYLKGDLNGAIGVTIDRAGGFLRCRVRDMEDGLTFQAWGAKLEQSATATAYQLREGT